MGQPVFNGLHGEITQGFIANIIKRISKKRLNQHLPCLFRRNAPAHQVEKMRVINLANRGTVRTGHVIGVNLQLGLGIRLTFAGQQQRPAHLVAISVLGNRVNQNLALKNAPGLIVKNTANNLH